MVYCNACKSSKIFSDLTQMSILAGCLCMSWRASCKSDTWPLDFSSSPHIHLKIKIDTGSKVKGDVVQVNEIGLTWANILPTHGAAPAEHQHNKSQHCQNQDLDKQDSITIFATIYHYLLLLTTIERLTTACSVSTFSEKIFHMPVKQFSISNIIRLSFTVYLP